MDKLENTLDKLSIEELELVIRQCDELIEKIDGDRDE